MDEFTNIAIWLIIIFLTVNSSIIWFAGQDVFLDAGLGVQGLTPNNSFTEQELIIFQGTIVETNCSTASANPFSYIPCFIGQVFSFFNELATQLWNLVTAWSNLLGAILPENMGGSLIQDIIGPLLGGIAFIGIFVILLRVAAIARGVS